MSTRPGGLAGLEGGRLAGLLAVVAAGCLLQFFLSQREARGMVYTPHVREASPRPSGVAAAARKSASSKTVLASWVAQPARAGKARPEPIRKTSGASEVAQAPARPQGPRGDGVAGSAGRGGAAPHDRSGGHDEGDPVGARSEADSRDGRASWSVVSFTPSPLDGPPDDGSADGTPPGIDPDPASPPAVYDEGSDPEIDDLLPPVGQDGPAAALMLLGPVSVLLGEVVTVPVSVENVESLSHAPLRISFNPDLLEYVEAVEGDFLASDGMPTQFFASPGTQAGEVFVALSRVPPTRGISGSGTLCSLLFRATGRGGTAIVSAGSRLLDSSGHAVDFRRDDPHVLIQ